MPTRQAEAVSLEQIECPHCREFVSRLADYAHYLRQLWDPAARGIGKRIEEEIRQMIKEHSNDDLAQH